jgi:hypothetical protein
MTVRMTHLLAGATVHVRRIESSTSPYADLRISYPWIVCRRENHGVQ